MTRFPAALVLSLVLISFSPVFAQDSEADDEGQLPTIAEKTDALERIDGFVPLYWDAREGTLWMEVSRFDTPFLYVTSLPAGLGSNPVGLDRGQLGSQRVVQFERTLPLSLEEDTHVIVATIGEESGLGPVMGPSHADDKPIAVSNPIYVDVDGEGFEPNSETLGAPLPTKAN